MKKILMVMIVAANALFLPACKSKPKDADVKVAVESAIMNNPDYNTVRVDVNNGVATVTGEVKDAGAQSSLKSVVAGVKGVKEVKDNTTIAAPAAETAPVIVNADEQLQTSIQAAVKDHPGVTATVKDGIVTLTGTINKSDLPTLMQKINATRPKKIENKLTVK